MEDGCVRIMWFLDSTRRAVESWLERGYWMLGEMVVKRLWLRAGWSCPHRGWEMVV